MSETYNRDNNSNFKDFLPEPIPIAEQIWNEHTPPLVSISCITYNHENYIREAIEGFLMQETTFPVEILIHDDASTDNTANIIREYEIKYPSLIKPIYQTENQYSKQDGTIGRIQIERTKGKYYATCEGDDYWDNHHKLQIQVDFLEKNPKYCLVYTNYRKFLQGRKIFKTRRNYQINNIEDLLIQNNIGTLTICLRLQLLKDYYNTIYKELPPLSMGDYPKWLYLSTRGKFKYIDQFCAVYRVLPNSASHSMNENRIIRFNEDIQKCKEFFIDKYLPVRKDLKFKAQQTKLARILTLSLIHNNKQLFKRYSDRLVTLKSYNRKLFFIFYISNLNFSVGCLLFKLKNK